jgi:hypothetical protein
MKKISQVIFLMFIYFGINAQHVFNKQYYDTILNSQNDFQRCNGVIQTSDGGYLVCGVGNNGKKMSSIKLDRNGDTLWSFIGDLGPGASDYLIATAEASDSNYLVVGYSGDTTLSKSHADLIKLDKNSGDTMWCRKIGLPLQSERFYSIKKTNDNGLILTGLRYRVDLNGSTIDSDLYIVKTDSSGILEWEQTFGGNGYEWGQSVEITDDGGFMVFGTTDSYGGGSYDAYLIKTDPSGNMLWQKTYGAQYVDYGGSLTKLQNGDYILAGGSSISSDSTVAVAIKINSEGTEIWNRRYPPTVRSMEFTAVKQLSSGEIMVTGSDQGDTLNNSFYGILKSLDLNNGDIIWERQYHLFEDDSTQHYFYSMDTCSDGGLVMGGMIIDRRGINSIVGNSYWVVKTDCAGNEYVWDNAACPKFVGLDEIEKDALFNLYPNPSTGAVTLDYFIPQNTENQSISFYDATGKLVQKVDFTGEGQIQLNIDCSGFSNGVYQCVLVSDGEVLQQGKLVLIP